MRLARLATRTEIKPLAVHAPVPPKPVDAFRDFFGVEVQESTTRGVIFSVTDAERPFLTANEGMWDFFEPQLSRRLSSLEQDAGMRERARAVLLELLPTGETSADAVSRRLAVSKRTLQRRLKEEQTTFQEILDETRGDLARHYLKSSRLSSAEISLLLGFEDSSSFFRAFKHWTGVTPEGFRATV